MSRSRNRRASRWLRLFAVGVVTSPVLIVAVAVVGRHGHRSAALVAMAAIYTVGQTYSLLCLWQVYRATLAPAPRDL